MSFTELNRGKLIPLSDDEGVGPDDVIIRGQYYSVELSEDREPFDGELCSVNFNDDGSIDFLTVHYNGACHFTEVLEGSI